MKLVEYFRFEEKKLTFHCIISKDFNSFSSYVFVHKLSRFTGLICGRLIMLLLLIFLSNYGPILNQVFDFLTVSEILPLSMELK